MEGSEAPDVSVVVPTYRGEGSLEDLVVRLDEVLTKRVGAAFELVLVNDASPDGTWDQLLELARGHPQLRAINLLRNHGQPTATMCGMAHSRGRVVVTMDDDLQHPPEEIDRLLDALDADPSLDAVVGSWGRDEGILRDVGSWIHAKADRLAHGTPRGFRHSAFRAIRGDVAAAMVAHQTRTPVVGPLLTRVTTRIANVPVRHDPRKVGTSNFRWIDGIRIVSTNFIHGSTLPLRMISGFGVTVAFLALLAGGVLFLRSVFWGADTPAGWLSVFLATVFFGGILLFQVGLVGQYIHVIVREVAGSPRWVVRSTVTNGRETAGPLDVPADQSEEAVRGDATRRDGGTGTPLRRA